MEVKQHLRAQEERSQSSRLVSTYPEVSTLCGAMSVSVPYNTLGLIRGGVVCRKCHLVELVKESLANIMTNRC